MNLLSYSVEAFVILAAITSAYRGVQLDKVIPPKPRPDMDPEDAHPDRLDPMTAGAIFGFSWGPPY